MPVNPHRYAHEKIGNGLRSLMAYGHAAPSGRAFEHWNRIRARVKFSEPAGQIPRWSLGVAQDVRDRNSLLLGDGGRA